MSDLDGLSEHQAARISAIRAYGEATVEVLGKPGDDGSVRIAVTYDDHRGRREVMMNAAGRWNWDGVVA